MKRRESLVKTVNYLGFIGLSKFFTQCTHEPFLADQSLRLEFLEAFQLAYLQNDYLELRWEAENIRYLRILFSQDEGLTWDTIVERVDADLAVYAWKIEADPGIGNQIRIEAIDSSSLSIESPVFQILTTYSIDLSPLEKIPEIGERYPIRHNRLGELMIERKGQFEFVAFSLICPHNGCIVEFAKNLNRFSCPCHGSSFSSDGCLILGPAEEALQQYSAKWVESDQTLLVIISSKKLSC